LEKKRDIDRLLSIFDLKIQKALNLPESVSTRVLFIYDKEGSVKEFKLLSKDLSKEMDTRITAWLMKNMNVDDLISSSSYNDIDADHLPRAVNY